MIPGDTKKSSSSPSPTIIKINHQNNQKSSGRSRTASSSSSTNNNRNSTRSYPRTGTLPPQQHDTREFVRNASARSSTVNPQHLQHANAPPRPYKSPDLYANTRSFKTDPRNQVLPSPNGGTLHANPTTYATVMSNQRTMQYKEERVNGEIVSQSVHKQERMNHA